MSSNVKTTAWFKMLQVMQSGEPVKVHVIAKKLSIKVDGVSLRISQFQAMKGAQVQSIRQGREVVSYQLMNASELNLPPSGETRGRKPAIQSEQLAA
ncbi:MAG: hypothetical protein ACRDFB_09025 [Rhabdochlamydiaceae bacterium]